MPSKSKSQNRFFQMLAHNPEKRKNAGISKAKAEEFVVSGAVYKSLPEKKAKKK